MKDHSFFINSFHTNFGKELAERSKSASCALGIIWVLVYFGATSSGSSVEGILVVLIIFLAWVWLYLKTCKLVLHLLFLYAINKY